MTQQPSAPSLLASTAQRFREHRGEASILLDFDGTIAPIAPDPAAAFPLPGSIEQIHRLAASYRTVAVISGRSASYLMEALELASHPRGLEVFGLYGNEHVLDGTTATLEPSLVEWQDAIAWAASVLHGVLGGGATMEVKPIGLTAHWRRAPERAEELWAVLERLAHETGLSLRAARRAGELLAPSALDKGDAVRRLTNEPGPALFVGDDAGDLPAFTALHERTAAGGGEGLAIGVASDDSPASIYEAADLIVDGPEGAAAFLRELDA